MPLKKRASLKVKKFNLPVSYRINETEERLRDCRNVYSGQDRLIKRNGSSRYNAEALASGINSVSYYEKPDGTQKILAKAGTVLSSVAVEGSGLPTGPRPAVQSSNQVIVCSPEP